MVMRMNSSRLIRSGALAICLAVPLAIGAGGCSSEDSESPAPLVATTSDARGAGGQVVGIGRRDAGLVPLALGREWRYSGSSRFEVVTAVGGGEVTVVDRDDVHTIIGTENRSGRAYWLLEQVIDEHDFGGTTQWVRMRQNRLGLYEADVSLNQPPAGAATGVARVMAPDAAWESVAASIREDHRDAYRRAWTDLRARLEIVARPLAPGALAVPGRGDGVDPGELTRLAYPLHPGRSWVILDDPEFTALVEAHEMVPTEAGNISAYRIRIANEFLSPRDDVWVWYGSIGMVAEQYHVETIATDELGNPIGTLIADGRLVLTGTNFTGPQGVQ